jgi:cytochrome c-type biogenesis protein CcmH/NrfF
MKRLLALILALVLLSAGSAVAATCPRTSVADLEEEVMCPVCGTSLGLAREAPQARRERAFIAKLVASCRSKDDVKAALVREFGPGVLALPSSRGFGAAAYVLPIAGGLIVAGSVLLMLVRWRRGGRRSAAQAARPLPAGAEAARLDAELDRLR